jgi:lipoyl(octanoyl) transferase
LNPTPQDNPDRAGRRRLRWSFLGRVPYGPTFGLQHHLRGEIRAGRREEHLLLLEHSPVFTLGRNATGADVVASRQWLAERGVEVHRSNRGGQVTYHGPGQLVGYPIVNLNPDRRDVRRYVHDLQESLIRTLADYGVEARRREGQAYVGVWVGEEKIASIGVHLARWITLHGFALNVATDLDHFAGIVACGLPQVRMTSIERLTGEAPPLADVAVRHARHFAEIFDRELVAVPPGSLVEMLHSMEAPEIR